MNSATHYRELADDLRYRACLAANPKLREQLETAAHDYDEFAREAEEEAKEPL
jgi:hypothetical protein